MTDTGGLSRWAGSAGPDGAGETEIRPDTPFFIASITKRFIVTLILQAHERNEVDLDAPITTYLPTSVTAGLHVRDGVDRTPAITVRHLAGHTSGLPDYFEKRRGGPSLYRQLRAGHDMSWTFEDAIAITRELQRPHFEPQNLTAGTQRARYSDTGFLLLIRILETVTSRRFSDLLAERIILPLGLSRTWHPSAVPAEPSPPAPLPLHRRRRRVVVDGVIAASNDLFSTTRDLLAFERALVNGDLFGDANTRHLLTARRNRLRNAPGLRYGLGTMIFGVGRLNLPRRGPVSLVGHSGSTGTWLFTCPELGLHLAGTVDQTQARVLPFRIMTRCLQIWDR
ncbi:serine hydrolase domain-containing protein [Nocardia sp. NBC_01329]|uniref:serine hydrolase domain-containing protein n=1 Tax=Nocardia sp. NBC_01329 TaxID=2903594 RepID=UPI002E1324C2|nr:beta-lactamase family protein [Nocardia sp. NBC_01329]